MSKSELLKRIEALNRRPLKHRLGEDAPDRTDGGTPDGRDAPGREPLTFERDVYVLDGRTRGIEIETVTGHRAALFRQRGVIYGEDLTALSDDFACALDDPVSPVRRLLEPFGGPAVTAREEVVFFDLETMGLRNEPIFLVGTMVWREGELEIRQFFAREIEEEYAILSAYVADLTPRTWFISFNGKSFDMPYTRRRAAQHAIPFHPIGPHLDLLHVSRRLWGHMLPNCRLQTLERVICARHRVGDIPGAEIPSAYRRFVRTGRTDEVAAIVQHNALDLLTLADLTVRLSGGPPASRRRPRRRDDVGLED